MNTDAVCSAMRVLSSGTENAVTVYVGNLSPNTSEGQIRELFVRFGKVDRISMDKQPHSDNAYVYCFLEMRCDLEASMAIRELNGGKLDGHALVIKESGVRI